MKCLLTYKLSLSLFSPEITFENTNFSIISRETKTEIMWLSLSMSLRIFVNPGPADLLRGELMPNNLKKKCSHWSWVHPRIKTGASVYFNFFCDREFRTSVSMHAILLVAAVDYFYNHNLGVGDAHAAAEGKQGQWLGILIGSEISRCKYTTLGQILDIDSDCGLDHHQNWIICSLCQCEHFLKVFIKICI